MGSSRVRRKSRSALWVALLVFLVLLLVPAVFGVFFYNNAAILSANAVINRKTLVGITTTAVSTKLNRLVNIDASMMSDADVVKDAVRDNWSGAAGVLRDLQNDPDFYDPYIDRIVLFSATGTETAAYPELAGGIGTNFASSTWYSALQGGAPSFVSTVTKRTSIPQLDVISIAAPIISGTTTIGYGTLQVPTVNFLEFGSDVSLGTFGFVFIVDQQGNIVAHPRYSSGNETVLNISSVPIIQQVLSGNSGTSESFSPEDDETIVSTYAPVPGYGWGVVAEEPYDEIFSAANSMLFAMNSAITLLLLIDLGIAYLVFRSLNHRNEK